MQIWRYGRDITIDLLNCCLASGYTLAITVSLLDLIHGAWLPAYLGIVLTL